MRHIRQFEIKRYTPSGPARVADLVATEEPLDIRIQYRLKDSVRTQSLALTMRTPGADGELAAGLLLSEGVVSHRDEIVALRHLGIEPSNEILVELGSSVDVEAWRLTRDTVVNSSCGVCGKRSLDQLLPSSPIVSSQVLRVAPNVIEGLPAALAEGQTGFRETGGLHAAALFDTAGHLLSMFEDIGRHNALDKLTGDALLRGQLPLSDKIIFLSSRSSFELVQKTIRAGGSVLATVGGPSSLAIETARQFGITLIGFLREGRFNVYSGDWRID